MLNPVEWVATVLYLGGGLAMMITIFPLQPQTDRGEGIVTTICFWGWICAIIGIAVFLTQHLRWQ